MKLIEEILHEVKKTEVNYITNIVVQYQDLEGENFFERMEFLRYILNILTEENNLYIVEDKVVPMKQWSWDLPIYFDTKYKFLQFDLRRVEDEKLSRNDPFTVECGSIWQRPVDGTVIQIQAIEGEILYSKTIGGPGLVSDILNRSILQMFWSKKKQ
jgi:hypothetical protein